MEKEKVKIAKRHLYTYDDSEKISDTDDDSTPTNKESEKKFTQEELNKVVAKEKRKFEDKHNELMSQVEELKQFANLKDEDRKRFEEKVQELQSSKLTTEQKYQKELKSLQDQFESTKTQLNEATEFWRNQFSTERKRNDILSAATANEHKAYNPNQIYDLLAPKTEVKPIIDDQGKETGDYQTVTKIRTKDNDGSDVTVEMPVKDAVKHMFDNPDEYGNLFESNLKGGIHSSNNNRDQDGVILGEGSAKYRETRKKHPDKVGLRR